MKAKLPDDIEWQLDEILSKIDDYMADCAMVGYSGGGGKNKPGVIMSIETDKDGNKFVIKKDKEGNVVSRKPAKPLPGKK